MGVALLYHALAIGTMSIVAQLEADTIVWLATLPDDGPTGQFFHDRKLVAW